MVVYMNAFYVSFSVDLRRTWTPCSSAARPCCFEFILIAIQHAGMEHLCQPRRF
ncbi:hypothetical protein SPRG_11135 [Saprolegnia parasitica CBS 223.65]|uniref:Uncharacterized protein n=1 Tax=Saprolegnia parasitica (strain CBS 223.65) TaxID=695850 RepID=A0A067CA86_SAPPC|nr:hypothetical protein SPRG_11135 [Saprolegnia parasitica CBS 223.65]KDO23687.1 hypothetical protein SPRG_11135 [Saprolegnia parasitica CBS 223.65]|eukprot:XP_012205670.1 hypothetical protein SPRG_11135 [Saprolegnia parasitica CBS 223.65]